MQKNEFRRCRATVTVMLLAAMLAGCASAPTMMDSASKLSTQDPKWSSPECQEIRSRAASYEANEKQTMSWATGLLFGPYGLGMAAAGKQHQAKLRKEFRREMHQRCSSQPLPRDLQG